jgi:TolA-binding protein
LETTQTVVEVEALAQFKWVPQVHEHTAAGKPGMALELAFGHLAGEVVGEQAEALSLVRLVALQHPSDEVLMQVDGAAERFVQHAEALEYLACETSVLMRRPADAVTRCRRFVEHHPRSPLARDASYVSGTLAREHLSDCASAVADYSSALLFAGPLGSLNDDALFWRAWCQADLGHREEARQDLLQFLARYPSRRVDPKVQQLQLRMGSK